MMRNGRACAAIAGVVAFALAGCQMDSVKENLDSMSESLDENFASLDEDMNKAGDFFEDRVGPVDEHTFGLSFAGHATAGAGLYNPFHPFTDYMRRVGTTVALASRFPYTYGGYVFAVLDSDRPNAIAVPGGFILISRGMIETVRSEDELAAVLAHEVAHQELRHNMLSVQQGKSMQIIDALFRDPETQQTNDWITRIGDEMTGGYNLQHETEADRRAVTLLARAGYDPYALVRVLRRLRDRGGHYGGRTYPRDRIGLIEAELGRLGLQRRDVPAVRQQRFREAIAGFFPGAQEAARHGSVRAHES